MPSKLRTVTIGVGNAYSGDDAAGLAAAQRLREVASDPATNLAETEDPATRCTLARNQAPFVVLMRGQSRFQEISYDTQHTSLA